MHARMCVCGRHVCACECAHVRVCERDCTHVREHASETACMRPHMCGVCTRVCGSGLMEGVRAFVGPANNSSWEIHVKHVTWASIIVETLLYKSYVLSFFGNTIE